MKSLASAAGVMAALMFSNHGVMAQPAIANVFPNGSYQFQYANALTFSATSSAGIASVEVTLTATTLFGTQGFPLTLTSSSGLTISGTANSENVSAMLISNVLYTAKIVVTDVNAASVTNSLSFDTISPAYTWEARDWDYTSNGVSGLFIDNPQTNAYAGLNSTAGADFNNPDYDNGTGGVPSDGSSSYRPQGLETEGCGDAPRLAYSPYTTNQDYDVGYCNGGNWGNYTRHYPPGQYNVFVRASDGNGAQSDAGDISVLAGTASFAGTGPYYFSVKSTGWQTYGWYPLTDSSNEPAVITIPDDGTASTLRLTIDGGNCNAHFFMLLPINTNVPPVGVGYVTNFFPNGAYQFQQTNTFNCTVISTNGIESVVADVAGSYLSGGTFDQALTASSGLTITGNATNESVSFLLTTDALYSVTFLITDGNGNGSTTNITFDTINPNYYTWEAEDWDYSGGMFFDNPQTNAYYDLHGEADIDAFCSGGAVGENDYLRGSVPITSDEGDLNTVGPNGDTPRLAYLNTNAVSSSTGLPYVDYSIGFTSGGQWGDYTRHYPSGTFNVYVRVADGGNATSDAGSLSLVTSGYDNTNQTLSQIGTFNVPATGGWNTYAWTPVLNAAGYPARFVGNGSQQTIRMSLVNANCNLNFYMLVPANLNNNPPPFVSNFTPDGSEMFQPSNQVTFTVTSSVGISTNNVILYLNGIEQSNLTFSGSSYVYNVACPIQNNQFYTAVIDLSDSAGNTAYTNGFGTYSPSNYQLAAADYDYTTNGTSGQFFDNQIDAYTNLGGAGSIDILESDLNAFSRGYVYRAENGTDFPDTSANDLPRQQFAGLGDYSIGSFGPGSWANYTRHYPAGTYNVVGRFAEGASLSHARLSILTGGYGTSDQTTNSLGTFNVALGGWSSWEWAPLEDGNGNLVKVTLDGNLHTLQLDGSTNGAEPEVNVHFLMLVPTAPSPVITPKLSAGQIVLSFTIQSGYTYEMQYANSLANPTWTQVSGSALITGTGATNVVDTIGSNGSRFYRLLIQPAP
ncbi:MAG TPA: hypothetical protein VMH30_00230 [Verrucomicrobiae bacterium]|nr:hypothetical protein [Verrucomicrobiae bacterium]